MILADFKQKIKTFGTPFQKQDFLISAIVVLVAFASFGLGRLSRIEQLRPPVKISQPGALRNSTEVAAAAEAGTKEKGSGETSKSSATLVPGGRVVASKNGTKYHFPWCAGAKQISEQNKIWFDSAEAARAAGYTPASNCKGLK